MHPEEIFNKDLPLAVRYRRNGWPAQLRPDAREPEGWEVSAVAGACTPHHHSPSPDGRSIAFVWNINDQSDIYLLEETGWPRRLTFARPVNAPWNDSLPEWSPDGSRLAYTQKGGIWIVAAAGGAPKRLTDPELAACSPRWVDSRRLLCVIDRDKRDQLFLIDTGNPWPHPLATSLPGDIDCPRPSPDGKQALFTLHLHADLHTTALYSVDLAGGEPRLLRRDDGFVLETARWQPGGDWIAYNTQRSGWWELCLIRPDGTGDHALTAYGKDVETFAFSPEGNQLAAVVNRGGEFTLELISLSADGTMSGEPVKLPVPRGLIHRPHFRDTGRITFEFESPMQSPEIYQIEWKSRALKRLTYTEPAGSAAYGHVMPEAVTYPSADGLEIPAFLYRPAKPNGAAVVHPHGGPTDQQALEWDAFTQYFVSLGYTWLAPNFRGSTGYGLAFQKANEGVWGTKDTDDCLAGARFLAASCGVDPKRIAIYGASYGSYLAVCALAREPDTFACGLAKFGDCNILTSWATGDRPGRLDMEKQMRHPSFDRAAWRSASPVYEVAKIRKPLLIAHGLRDERVHPLESEELAEALLREGKTFEYVTYSNEGHGFFHAENVAHFTRFVRRFLDWYLL